MIVKCIVGLVGCYSVVSWARSRLQRADREARFRAEYLMPPRPPRTQAQRIDPLMKRDWIKNRKIS